MTTIQRSSSIAVLIVLIAACTNQDVGEADQAGTGATSGVGGPAAGSAAGVDTAGTRVNTSPAGSVVAPGAGQTPGTTGAPGSAGGAGGDTAAAKTKGARP